MEETASKLQEYPVVMAMKDAGVTLRPQLLAEIDDMTGFTHKGAITAFARVYPGVMFPEIIFRKAYMLPNTARRYCGKTLFQIMNVLIKTKLDDAVYLFMGERRAQGKPYYLYMTAGVNKFLCIYYGRVKEYLSTLSTSD